ncbi:MAG TPA: RsmE family RNA methyltransferase [Spirochaetota bacterium]|nr:RsmE family RNA methyltransferase [Spirochaetota bacterium]HOL57174.1 RsmE family RNA methyltransferase [Spirochaetota bacterium]HPP04802.1 RsmE family RNA methyltransferase [Spirochaetota bacterium]
MKKIFYDQSINLNDNIIIKDEEHHHLANVLRSKIGDSFVIGDSNGMEFVGSIIKITKNETIINIEKFFNRIPRLKNINLFFSILKGDKNEEIIKKCTEIGVDNFYPVITKNCMVKINPEESFNKINRWRIIAKESSMQALREKIPYVNKIILFEDLNKYAIKGAKFFGDIKSKKGLYNYIKRNPINEDNIYLFIGPEGDFTDYERDFLYNTGWLGFNLSNYILRSETAAITFCSNIMMFIGGDYD